MDDLAEAGLTPTARKPVHPVYLSIQLTLSSNSMETAIHPDPEGAHRTHHAEPHDVPRRILAREQVRSIYLRQIPHRIHKRQTDRSPLTTHVCKT